MFQNLASTHYNNTQDDALRPLLHLCPCHMLVLKSMKSIPWLCKISGSGCIHSVICSQPTRGLARKGSSCNVTIMRANEKNIDMN